MYHNIPKHRVIAIAAGVTLYALLAIFPSIAALVAIYGLIADPSTISQHLSDLSGVPPGGATEVIGDQLQRLTSQPPGKLGFALVFGLGVSLWSANAGITQPGPSIGIASCGYPYALFRTVHCSIEHERRHHCVMAQPATKVMVCQWPCGT